MRGKTSKNIDKYITDDEVVFSTTENKEKAKKKMWNNMSWKECAKRSNKVRNAKTAV